VVARRPVGVHLTGAAHYPIAWAPADVDRGHPNRGRQPGG
jgi:hypothetical protein